MYPSTRSTDMGKSIPSAANIRSVATRVVAAHSPFRHSDSTRKCRHIDLHLSSSPDLNSPHRRKPPNRLMEGGPTVNRVPLSEVVSDCVRRWFQDTLKEARAGDTAMQVLVGQMYYSGYGIPRDAHKGRAWMTRASKTRSSVWKVSDKHPGYNASDSDSDEAQCDSKQ